jgi:hypothetical protein
VGLNWIEFYHKSDNINLRTLNVSLWSNNYWELTDVMPLSLDSLFPYIGQINLDFADYENLPTGMNFYVTELDGTPSHSFDPAGNWTTSGNWDWFGVAINQTQAKLHFIGMLLVGSEGGLFTEKQGVMLSSDNMYVSYYRMVLEIESLVDSVELEKGTKDKKEEEIEYLVDKQIKDPVTNQLTGTIRVRLTEDGTIVISTWGFRQIQIIKAWFEYTMADGTVYTTEGRYPSDKQYIDVRGWEENKSGAYQQSEDDAPAWAESPGRDNPGFLPASSSSGVSGISKEGGSHIQPTPAHTPFGSNVIASAFSAYTPNCNSASFRLVRYFRTFLIPWSANSNYDIKNATSVIRWKHVFKLDPLTGQTLEPHSGTTSFESEGAPSSADYEGAPVFPYNKPSFKENVWQESAREDFKNMHGQDLKRVIK